MYLTVLVCTRYKKPHHINIFINPYFSITEEKKFTTINVSFIVCVCAQYIYIIIILCVYVCACACVCACVCLCVCMCAPQIMCACVYICAVHMCACAYYNYYFDVHVVPYIEMYNIINLCTTL